MNKKTLTITIQNIPENLYNDFWNELLQECNDEFGFRPHQVDAITIDMNRLFRQVDKKMFVGTLSDIVSGSLMAHIANEVDKKFNHSSL